MKPKQIKQAIIRDNPGITFIYRAFKDPAGQTVIGIDYFGLPKHLRGTGLAERAFQQLLEYADQYEIKLATTPTSMFGADSKRLAAKLDKFGFNINAEADSNAEEYAMYRENVYYYPQTETADLTIDPQTGEIIEA